MPESFGVPHEDYNPDAPYAPGEYIEPEEPEIWDRVVAWTQQDGTIKWSWETNDNEDKCYTGYLDCYGRLDGTSKDREAFIKNWGVSRTGCMGANVTRVLDNKKI